MSTILEADESGALRLPPSVLPHPGPHRRYRVVMQGAQVVVGEAMVGSKQAGDRNAWLQELAQRRARGATQKTGMPLQAILDEIRGERC